MNEIKHTMTLLIAQNRINRCMENADLRPSHKWYVVPVKIKFKTKTAVDRDYCMRIINTSKNNDDYWIPVIAYMENLFVDPEVKILSDGLREYFVRGSSK